MSGKPVTVQAGGAATFSGTTAAARACLRTNKSDFHNTSFVAEVSVAVNNGSGTGCAFVGPGAGSPDAGFYQEPRTTPANNPQPAGGDWSQSSNWQSGLIGGAANGPVADFSTRDLTANAAVTLASSVSLNQLEFSDTTPSHNWSLTGAAALTLAGPTSPVISVANQTTMIGAPVAGTNGLAKTGAGTLALTGNNTLTGPVAVPQGTLAFAGSYGSATLSIASGAVLELQVASGIRDYATSTLSGAGTLLKTGAGTSRWGVQAGTFALGAGSLVDVRAGAFDAGSSANENWSGNLSSLNVSSGATITELTCGPAVFDALTGSGSVQGTGGNTLTLGANHTAAGTYNTAGAATFSGVISSVSSLIKIGTGTQILSGTNTCGGSTTVGGGKLLINGSKSGSGPVTVNSGGTLGGSGSVAGATSVNSGGTLAPGSNGAGVLTLNNALTLAGGSKLGWEISNWTAAAGSGWDKTVVSSLDLTATSASRIVIRPAGPALPNFTETSASFLLVQTTSGITGFSADKFTVDTSGRPQPQGAWVVRQSGNNLELAYFPPNPDANANGILDTWEALRFGNANPGANLPGDDADHDGLTNLMEYALNSDPLTANASPLTRDLATLADGDHLRLSIPKNPAATNVTHIVETCGTLIDWSAADTVIETNTATQLIVRDTFNLTTASRRFIRLKVNSQP